jgi:UDP-glucose 4-epimerase
MKILVTEVYFIGSHTVVELQNEGFEVNCRWPSNTSLKVLDGIDAITGKFRHSKIRFTDRDKVQDFSKKQRHFRCNPFCKAVGESVENPLLYYENNVSALVYVLQELQKMTEANFILVHLVLFTSRKMPITEDASIQKRCLLMEIPSKLRRNHNRRLKYLT